MTKLFLDIAFVDLGRGGETRSQRMTGELEGALDLAEITVNAGRHRSPFHKPGYLLVVQPLRANSFPLPRHAAKEGTMRQFGELDPGFGGDDRGCWRNWRPRHSRERGPQDWRDAPAVWNSVPDEAKGGWRRRPPTPPRKDPRELPCRETARNSPEGDFQHFAR